MNKYKRFECGDHAVNGYSIGFDINQYGTLLASGSSTGNVCIYNMQSSKLVKKLGPFSETAWKSPCMDCKFNNFKTSNDKFLLAVSSWNGGIKIFQITLLFQKFT